MVSQRSNHPVGSTRGSYSSWDKKSANHPLLWQNDQRLLTSQFLLRTTPDGIRRRVLDASFVGVGVGRHPFSSKAILIISRQSLSVQTPLHAANLEIWLPLASQFIADILVSVGEGLVASRFPSASPTPTNRPLYRRAGYMTASRQDRAVSDGFQQSIPRV